MINLFFSFVHSFNPFILTALWALLGFWTFSLDAMLWLVDWLGNVEPRYFHFQTTFSRRWKVNHTQVNINRRTFVWWLLEEVTIMARGCDPWRWLSIFHWQPIRKDLQNHSRQTFSDRRQLLSAEVFICESDCWRCSVCKSQWWLLLRCHGAISMEDQDVH